MIASVKAWAAPFAVLLLLISGCADGATSSSSGARALTANDLGLDYTGGPSDALPFFQCNNAGRLVARAGTVEAVTFESDDGDGKVTQVLVTTQDSAALAADLNDYMAEHCPDRYLPVEADPLAGYPTAWWRDGIYNWPFALVTVSTTQLVYFFRVNPEDNFHAGREDLVRIARNVLP